MLIYTVYGFNKGIWQDRDREAMWRVLGVYGINGQLLKAVQSLYTVQGVRHVSGYTDRRVNVLKLACD